MRCVIVTGMSGAGKSTALNVLEDAGYYCVDNLPVQLVEKFTELAENSDSVKTNKIAMGIDIRSGKFLSELAPVLNALKGRGIRYEILFLDASDAVLVRRFKETRRAHPLARGGRIETGVQEERKQLKFLKDQADYIVDTSQLLTRDLKSELEKIFVENRSFRSMIITVLSFGFKFGIPADADLVFDVRFLPNPYYVEELKPLTGKDKAIRDYVMNNDTARQFHSMLIDMVKFLIPNYIREGKHQLVIAIGCTGGRHRSVTIAEDLFYNLLAVPDCGVRIEHRDMEHDNVIKRYQ
ncbi:MAG: RNase adapter RapZ [Bilifractor sp.]